MKVAFVCSYKEEYFRYFGKWLGGAVPVLLVDLSIPTYVMTYHHFIKILANLVPRVSLLLALSLSLAARETLGIRFDSD